MLPEFDIEIQQLSGREHQIVFKDKTHNCILDIEYVSIPSNLNSEKAILRHMDKRLATFVNGVTGEVLI